MDTYSLYKTLHIFGVTIFIGNIIVTGWWKIMADRTNNSEIIAFAQRQVTLTDYIFTLGGVLMILAFGYLNVWNSGIEVTKTPWIMWGLGAFSLSGVLWVGILVPVQRKQAQMSRKFVAGEEVPEEYRKLCRIWNFFGLLATITPIASIGFMVYKPF